jgi:PLP dependent protein
MKEKINTIKERIKNAALSCKRAPESVKLIAVSKTKSAQQVREAFLGGCLIFGENYIQEAKKKIEDLSDLSISWHFIGHLQSNKAKYAVKLFDIIHSVDSLKLALEINKQAEKINKCQKILIQINISEEETKSGIDADDAIFLVKQISGLKNLKILGLMGMPPFFDNPEKAAPFFKKIFAISKQIEKLKIEQVEMSELSMGMTGDFEAAIKEGATMVRIGTAIFGKRIYA